MTDTTARNNNIQIDSTSFAPGRLVNGDPARVSVQMAVLAPVMFELDCSFDWHRDGAESTSRRNLRQDGMDVSWLPRGRYQIDWSTPALSLPPGDYDLHCALFETIGGQTQASARSQQAISVTGKQTNQTMEHHWSIRGLERSPLVDSLSWRQGHTNWFFRHFDHAARTIISYMLADSPLLKGRVLDVGCGDGITDLGVFLRCQPERFVGVDPFKGYERLPEVLAENQLPPNVLNDERLTFLPADGNQLPFDDDSFDVVLSWGSLEHIVGGYMGTMHEIKRVLRDGGLFFVHPGLYYSNLGHHLGEFSSEPFFHLTMPEDELREFVLSTEPKRMDRSGHTASSAEYWQWYKELNPMTVAGFEQELKDMGFEFYRAALRTEPLIEYSDPKLQHYSMQDLATTELYLSAFNRK